MSYQGGPFLLMEMRGSRNSKDPQAYIAEPSK